MNVSKLNVRLGIEGKCEFKDAGDIVSGGIVRSRKKVKANKEAFLPSISSEGSGDCFDDMRRNIAKKFIRVVDNHMSFGGRGVFFGGLDCKNHRNFCERGGEDNRECDERRRDCHFRFRQRAVRA